MNIKFRGGLLGFKDFKMILRVNTAQLTSLFARATLRGIWRAVVGVDKHEGEVNTETSKAEAFFFFSWKSSPAAASIHYFLPGNLYLRLLPFGTKGASILYKRWFCWESTSTAGTKGVAAIVADESVPAKTAMFLEEMMNKESSREWQLADLVREGRERVREIEFFVGK
ncbi:hypothetical protein Tco_0683345 [Tanacetum coccineum]|uniref:Uncharacterized protein n=1 Tax=Tanacetum coccineum TaxID=301880 RepID=A0ABQ4XUT6_9ASTR